MSCAKRLYYLCLPVFLFGGLASSARADLVANGSFEEPPAGGTFVQRNPGDNINGWIVETGPIDHIGGLWQAAQGTQSIDLNANVAGGVAQDILTNAGTTYRIRFALAGNPGGFDDKRMEIVWDGVQIADLIFDQNGQTTAAMGWEYHEILAVAQDASTHLLFHSLTGEMAGTSGFNAFYGPALDDVSVIAVPEPGSIGLAAFGATALAVIAVRRRSKTNA